MGQVSILKTLSEGEIINRGIRALERESQRSRGIYQQPNSGLTRITKRGVLVFENINGVIARFDLNGPRLRRVS